MSKFLYVILELGDDSHIDVHSDGDQDDLADDLLLIADKVVSVEVFSSPSDFAAVMSEIEG